MDEIEELKTKGNAALSSGKVDEAIKFYSEGIALDADNQVLFSNRSAAYCKQSRYNDALKDAEEVIRIKPDWAKGYSRKGAALGFMNQHEEALMAYMEALNRDSQNEQIKQSIRETKTHLTGGGASGSEALLNPFADSQIWEKIEANERTKEYLKDPEYKRMIETLNKNPKELGKYMEDARIMSTLGMLLGVQLEVPTEDELKSMKEEKKIKRSEKKKTIVNEEALKEKELGNAAYKKKDFEMALKYYSSAIELEPNNIIYRNNKAAVYFEQKNYDECITVCLEAVEVGREQRADFKVVAKAFARIGNAYQKKEDLKNALFYFNKSLSEHRDPDVLKKSQEVDRLIKEQERLAFVDPEKSMEEKQKGNECFQKGDYPNALKHYDEAVKRNPNDAKLFSNRAACFTKLLEFNMALRDCDDCIRIDPTFVKGYLRKAGCLLALKDKTRAADVFQKALELDSNCQEAIDGYRSCMTRDSEDNMESVKRKAMQDPEVQQIISDPAMQMILQQMNKDPKALQEHLKNPEIAKKIEKLLEVGIIGFR